MITINGKSYSGAIMKSDETELIVTIYADASLFDICHAMDGTTSVTDTGVDGTEKVYMVNNATRVSESVKGVYVVSFSTKPTVLQEMSNTIDALLLMMLEKKDV